MTYHCSYKTNPIFPYTNQQKRKQQNFNLKNSSFSNHTSNKKVFSSVSPKNVDSLFSGLLDNILKPVEKLIGRKIKFDDLLLVGLIYLLFTEKENEDYSLLLCLLFVLFG